MLSLEQELAIADFRNKIKAFDAETLISVCTELHSQVYQQKNSFIELQKHHWFTPKPLPENPDVFSKLNQISDLFDEIFSDLIDAQVEQREILSSANTSSFLAIMDNFDSLIDQVISEGLNP